MLTSQTNGLITKGLGLPAEKGLITMFFTLFAANETPVVQPPVGGGGGHVPASSISSARYTYAARGRAVQMRNVPIPQSQKAASVPYYMPRRSGEAGKVIKITVSFGRKETTKEYLAADTKNMKVKVSGLFSQLDETIAVIAEGLFNKINIKK